MQTTKPPLQKTELLRDIRVKLNVTNKLASFEIITHSVKRKESIGAWLHLAKEYKISHRFDKHELMTYLPEFCRIITRFSARLFN